MVDRPDSKVDKYHSPNAGVKNEWIYVSFPSIRLHGMEHFVFHEKRVATWHWQLWRMGIVSVRLLLRCNTLYILGLYWTYMGNIFLLSPPYSCSNVRTLQKKL